MDANSKFIFSHIYVIKALKKNPKEAIAYIEKNRQLFNFTDSQIKKLKKEHGLE